MVQLNRPERVVVTGAAGFIGSSVAKAFLDDGRHVLGIDNFAPNYARANKERNVERLHGDRFELAEQDLVEAEHVADLVSRFRPDVVVHLAALGNVRASVTNPAPYLQSNVVGTGNVLDAAVAADVGHVVFASTSSVYGQRDQVPFRETDETDRPLAPYPATKKAGEVLGHAYYVAHSLSFSALRFFNVYGPHGRPDMMPWITLDALSRDVPITVFGDGSVRRDWTYIDDIVSGVVSATDRPLGYEIINLGRGEPASLNDFISIFERIEAREVKRLQRDMPPTEPAVTFADISKAMALLDYQPQVSLAEGLSRFHRWWSERDIRAMAR